MNIQEQIAEAEAKVAALKEEARKQSAIVRAKNIELVTTDGSTAVFDFLNNRAYVKVDGYNITLISAQSWTKEGRRKTRVSVSGEPDVDFTEAYAMQRANGEAHKEATGTSWYGKGAFPEEDKLFATLNRQVVAGKRDVLAEAMEAAENIGAILKGFKFSFSRTGGCSCGCSPAFIVNGNVTAVDTKGTRRNISDVFITKTEEV